MQVRSNAKEQSKSRNKMYMTCKERVDEENCNNWECLKKYLNGSFDQKQGLIVELHEKDCLSSMNQRNHFPYHSYLKNKKKKLIVADPYIISKEIKDCNKKHKISLNISFNDAKSFFQLTETVSINGKKPKEKTQRKGNLEDTTAKILESKHNSLYDKMHASRAPAKSHKLSPPSPFHAYLTGQRRKKLVESKSEMKSQQEVHEPAANTECRAKIYIGQQHFPLSIYERSTYCTNLHRIQQHRPRLPNICATNQKSHQQVSPHSAQMQRAEVRDRLCQGQKGTRCHSER
eukprot:TRINITY_DN3463_c0_g1_i3.p1 TRINITY_DN3463_c0_g1~~TRINITY_DN3463_c0_g1_i3.p1  ORF type:complete len:289 (+),score=28.71 TRINITY_DN3463_c0_g1_i3:1226-2092(+)